MRFLNYNIQAGIGTRNYTDYLVRLHHQVAATKAKATTLSQIGKFMSEFDIVCLQEIDLGGFRSGFRNQAETLQEASGLPHMITQTNRVVGHISRHGNAIFSKFPIEPLLDEKLPGKVKGRGLLAARIKNVVIANTHLSLGLRDQNYQFQAIADALKPFDRVVLSGDMNCEPSSLHFNEFRNLSDYKLHTSHEQPSFPAWGAKKSLDHILSRGIGISACQVGHEKWSDHLPVMAKIDQV